MSKPRVYIHRVEWCPYDVYMDEDNEELLCSFAEVVNDGWRSEPVGPEEMVGRLEGVQGILSLNGSHAEEVTAEALRQAGTVQVVAVAHWWGQHNEVAPAWQAACGSWPFSAPSSHGATGGQVARTRRGSTVS